MRRLIEILIAELAEAWRKIAAQDEEIGGLHEQLARKDEKIRQLSDELKVSKKLPKRPDIKPDVDAKKKSKPGAAGRRKRKRRGQQYSTKAKEKTVVLKCENVPPGAVRVGFRDYVVQELELQVLKIVYRRERWRTPDGTFVTAELPAHVNGHFGADLRRLVISLYHQGQSTAQRITNLLNDIGIRINQRTVVRMLTGAANLVAESQQVLAAGVAGAQWIHADDTGARHKAKNNYCLVVGNDKFTYFATCPTKSRLNFLQVLSGETPAYTVNAAAIGYMKKRQLANRTIALLSQHPQHRFGSESEWLAHLDTLGVSKTGAARSPPQTIATEGALWGALIESEALAGTVVLSDDAGQFNIGECHALCWLHAIRQLLKLACPTDTSRRIVDAKRSQMWGFYHLLQLYARNPNALLANWLRQRFDAIFDERTDYHALNLELRRLHANKDELLAVLGHPQTPLHNNLAENDIRAHVTRRKISFGTRSDSGRDARDAYLSLLKTCHKQGLSFWDYLGDRFRIPDTPHVPALPALVAQIAIPDCPT